MATYMIKRKTGANTFEDVLIATSGGSSGGPIKLSSQTTTININSDVIGTYFNVVGKVQEADELTVGSNSISLDSGRSYYVTVEGKLDYRMSSSTSATGYMNYWDVMVTVRDDGNSGSASSYGYFIQSSSGFNIADTGQNGIGHCRYSGILYK